MPNSRRSFLSHTLTYGVGTVALQAASIVLLPLYTHYLTPADYGVLEIIERTGQLVILLLLGNGIRMATFSFYCQAKSPEDRQRIFSSIATVLWLLLSVGAVLAILLGPYLASLLGIDSSNLVVLGILVVLLEGGVALPMALMQARVDSVAFVTVNFLMAVARMTLIVVAVAVLGLGVRGVLGGSAICFGIFAIVLTLREVASGFQRPDRKIMTEVIRFALPLLPAGLFGLILASADRFFLLRYATSADVGTYSLGYKLATVIPMVAITPIRKVWTARIYDFFKEPNASRDIGRAVFRILAIHVFIGLGICLFNVETVKIIAPVEYKAASLVIPLLTIASLLQLASSLFDSSLWVKRQTKWKPIITALSASAALVSYFILVPRFGSMGAALAVTIGYGMQASITFAVSQRIFFILYDWQAMGISLAIAVVLFAMGRCAGTGTGAILAKCIMWPSFPILLWRLNVANAEEKAWGRWQLTRAERVLSNFFPKTPGSP